MAIGAAGYDNSTGDLGRLVLRLSLGIMVLFHGVSKIMSGLGPVVASLERAALPTGLAYLVYLGEVVGPLLVILGLWTRVGALLILVNMIVAVYLVHVPQLLTMAKTGGYGLELQGMYLFGALAVMLLGAGRYSLGGVRGRFN